MTAGVTFSSWGFHTQGGPARTNADACHADARLLIVVDGMGGRPAPALAAHSALGATLGALEDDSVEELVAKADAAVRGLEYQDEIYRGAGACIVLARLADRSVTIAHVGDCRAYLLSREGRLQQLTKGPFPSKLG